MQMPFVVAKNNPIPFSLGCCLEEKKVILLFSSVLSRESHLKVSVFFIIRKKEIEREREKEKKYFSTSNYFLLSSNDNCLKSRKCVDSYFPTALSL